MRENFIDMKRNREDGRLSFTGNRYHPDQHTYLLDFDRVTDPENSNLHQFADRD